MFNFQKATFKKGLVKVLMVSGISLLGFAACKSDHKSANDVKDANFKDKICYVYMQNGDTITLTITPIDSLNFRGTMVYKLAEKDRNVGVLQGFRNGDTLLANYTFQSEGISSVRQVAFKMSDSTLVEGFGEIIQVKDTTKFQNPDALSFDSKMVLQQTKCY